MDLLTQHTVDAGAGVDAVASFENVAVLAPRGRFEVEMYLTFLKLVGQVRPHTLQGLSSRITVARALRSRCTSPSSSSLARCAAHVPRGAGSGLQKITSASLCCP